MPVFNPNAGRELPGSGIANVSSRALLEAYERSMFMLLRSVENAVLTSAGAGVDRVVKFAEGLEHLSHSSKSQLAQVHTELGRKMQRATVNAYKDHPKRATAPYRLSSRDAGGRMLAALSSPQMFRGTYDGIGFVNTTFLDKTARQWHRLNFGAKGKGGAITRPLDATWEGMLIGSFGFTDESPSAGFALPKGLWIGEGGRREASGASRTAMFYPQSERSSLRGKGILGRPGSAHLTQGIKAWNFLDAGVQTLAREIGPAYDDLYTGWFESAARGAGPLKKVINLPAPRARP